MERENSTDGEDYLQLHKRRTTLADGRYLIFYTFGREEATPPQQHQSQGDALPEPEPKTSAEEERHV